MRTARLSYREYDLFGSFALFLFEYNETRAAPGSPRASNWGAIAQDQLVIPVKHRPSMNPMRTTWEHPQALARVALRDAVSESRIRWVLPPAFRAGSQ